MDAAEDEFYGRLEYHRDMAIQCQETSTRDAANKHSLELCASTVLLFLDALSDMSLLYS